MALPFRLPTPDPSRVASQYVTFAEARAIADDLRDGSVADHTYWSSRKANVLKLHALCRGLIAERERVAKRVTRHARLLASLLLTDDIHETIVATVARDLPDLTRASIEQGLASLSGAIITAMGDIRMVTGG